MAETRNGYAPAFLNCGGIGQPPLVFKWRGRWYRTLWEAPPSEARHLMADPEMIKWVKSLGALPFGLRRFMDYQVRSGKGLFDIPLLEAPPEGARQCQG